MKLICAVCGHACMDFYIVRKKIWETAGLKAEDLCCLECLSGRLGRELTLSDFDPVAPINRLLILGYRMGRRLGESGDIPELPTWPPVMTEDRINGL